MKFLSSLLKDKSKRMTSDIEEAATSPKDEASESPMEMEWDKIYVEIDNDAISKQSRRNQSPTQRRRNIGMPESQKMYDEYDGSKISTSALLGYGGESPCCSPNNINDSTIADSRTFLTRNPSSETQTTATRTFDAETMDERSRVENHSITKEGDGLTNNYFANVQLMRWKTAAEEGPFLIQTLVFLSAISAIFTTIYPLVVFEDRWSIASGICAFHTTIMCLLIITFEIRVCGDRNPKSSRVTFCNFLVLHLNLLRSVWGRGFLYIFAGSMNMTMVYYPYNYITGGILIALGFLSILVGSYAAFNLERLRLSLTDPSYLWNKFVQSDSDDDNLINMQDFRHLLSRLGLELDDSYAFRAFSEIDRDRDGLINFNEFKHWWIASQDDDGTIVTMDMSKLTMDFSSKAPTNRRVPVPIQISTCSGNGSETKKQSV